MTESVDQYLTQLNNSLKSTSSNRGNEAADISNDLRAHCNESIRQTQIGSYHGVRSSNPPRS